MAECGQSKIDFEYLNRSVIDALSFEKLPASRLTSTAAAMVRILNGERERIVRVTNWNKANAGSVS